MIGSEHIAFLISPNATDILLFGAKAANLAKAVQLGFSVPNGMAISKVCTEAEFVLLSQNIIEELSPPIAVRSSATGEDSETKSFAGLFETHLGVGTTVDLLNAFASVKSSGASVHIKKYHGEEIPPEQIAVLVQCMVNATRAGVAFSRDPITGEPNVIIESNYGLGKSVVEGDVTPDSIEYLPDGTYKTFIGRKSTKITLYDKGIHIQETPPEDAKRCSLTDEEINGIAKLTQKVERDLGFPADIEWAFDFDGKLWLLQARPITTL